ncbi:hypothetical protein PIB30_100482 [Stylosanthes scabra]|uniref:Uncharacterized protein n=1 Tax=Stylosanthes scabra TaxID=79078 RepID=A0ABU6VYW6_9FABA|nr:hypothetical protein [Stylosanthes scabra]
MSFTKLNMVHPPPRLGAPIDVPAPSAPSSPEPSRKDFMRALRRNKRIMRRHEQLMLMLHPGLDTSGLEQKSSPEISQKREMRKRMTTFRVPRQLGMLTHM